MSANLPWKMGEEDKLALRINPRDLGAPVSWFKQIWNWSKDGKKTLGQLNNNASAWNGNTIAPELLARVNELVKGDIQSMNPHDLISAPHQAVPLTGCMRLSLFQ